MIRTCQDKISYHTLASTIAYSRVRNKHTPMFIKFWNFFQWLRSYCGLKRLKFYYISLHILRDYVYSSCLIFQRLPLFKGLCLLRTLEYLLQNYIWGICLDKCHETYLQSNKITKLKNFYVK